MRVAVATRLSLGQFVARFNLAGRQSSRCLPPGILRLSSDMATGRDASTGDAAPQCLLRSIETCPNSVDEMKFRDRHRHEHDLRVRNREGRLPCRSQTLGPRPAGDDQRRTAEQSDRKVRRRLMREQASEKEHAAISRWHSVDCLANAEDGPAEVPYVAGCLLCLTFEMVQGRDRATLPDVRRMVQ